MAKRKPAGVGLVAVVATEGDELRLTIRSVRTRKRIAVVVGSVAFLRRALLAVGLGAAPLIPGLAKNGHRARLPLVGRKPANGNH